MYSLAATGGPAVIQQLQGSWIKQQKDKKKFEPLNLLSNDAQGINFRAHCLQQEIRHVKCGGSITVA